MLDRRTFHPSAVWFTAASVAAMIGSVGLVGSLVALDPGRATVSAMLAYFSVACAVLAALTGIVVLANRAARPSGEADRRLSEPAHGVVAPFLIADDEEEAALRREQMRHVFTQLYLMMALNIVNATLLAIAIAFSAPPVTLAIWYAAIVLLSVLAIIARYSGRNRTFDRPVSKRAIRRIAMHSGVRGLLWGLGIALFFADAGPTGKLLLASVEAGMLAGGVLALAPVPPAALAYGLGILVPSALRFVSMGALDYVLLTGFALSFAGSLALICAHFYRNFAGQLLARRAAAEQAATISLLLNEFEATASDWLWETDAGGRFTRLPPRMAELLGVDTTSGTTPTLDVATSNAQAADRAELVSRLSSGGAFRDVVIACTRPGGEPCWIAFSATEKAGGGWRGVGSDRTLEMQARLQSIGALARAEQAEIHLKDGIDSLSAGFVLCDSEDRTVISNRRFASLFPAADLLGERASFEAIVRGQAAAWFHAAPDRGDAWINRLLDQRRTFADVVDLALPDGRWLRLDARATRDGGIVTIFTEITDIKQQEERLELQSAQLSASNDELSRFAYVASHDLQEPLRKIEAFGGRLKTRAGAKLDDESRHFVDRMLASTQRMRRLVTDLLDYSRVARSAAATESVALDAIVTDVLDDLSITIEEKGAAITAKSLGSVQGDETLLRQLFQNLLSNALKFRRPDVAPHISISGARLASGTLEIRVSDNGIGFDMKHHDRIFEIFQRLHGKSEFEGTGIGLATCARIVKQHGGTIRAESMPGEGTTFILSLPESLPASQPAHASAA